MIVATAVFYALLYLIAHLWLRHQGRSGLLIDDLRSGAGMAVAAGVILALCVVGASRHVRRRFQAARDLEAAFRGVLGRRSGAEVLLLALFSGTAEEVLFRGAMQEVLGLVPTSLIFGAVHFIPQRVYLSWTFFAVVVGFLLGGIYEWTGNIYAPLTAHVVINALNLRMICGPEADPTPPPSRGGPPPREETPPPPAGPPPPSPPSPPPSG